MKHQHTELIITFGLLALAELLLDVIAGDWIKQWIQEHFGTIPAILGFLAVLVLIWVRVRKYESLAGGSRKRGGRKKR